MGMRVLLHEHVLTLAWTVVGLVALRCNDPIPSKRLKIHCEWVATASRFSRVLVTVPAKITTRTLCRLENFHLQERLLEIRGWKKERGKNKKRLKLWDWKLMNSCLFMNNHYLPSLLFYSCYTSLYSLNYDSKLLSYIDKSTGTPDYHVHVFFLNILFQIYHTPIITATLLEVLSDRLLDVIISI